ncbi:hypothetical protein D3C71_2242640 [compost metagenome]
MDDIPSWAQAEVAAAHMFGIVSGRGNNLFAPHEKATRAEAIAIILAMHSKVK